MDELLSIKNRKREAKFGDVKKACSKVGVSSTVFYTALSKTTVDKLTDSELRVIVSFRDILNDRKCFVDSIIND